MQTRTRSPNGKVHSVSVNCYGVLVQLAAEDSESGRKIICFLARIAEALSDSVVQERLSRQQSHS